MFRSYVDGVLQGEAEIAFTPQGEGVSVARDANQPAQLLQGRDSSGALHAAGTGPRSVLETRSMTSDTSPYFASGSGRSWNFTTLLVVPLPPSMWNGARVLTVDHSPLPFQPAVRIVDAAVQPLRVEAERIRHAQHDPLAVLQRQQAFGRVAGVDRRVPARGRTCRTDRPTCSSCLPRCPNRVTPLNCGSGSG